MWAVVVCPTVDATTSRPRPPYVRLRVANSTYTCIIRKNHMYQLLVIIACTIIGSLIGVVLEHVIIGAVIGFVVGCLLAFSAADGANNMLDLFD